MATAEEFLEWAGAGEEADSLWQMTFDALEDPIFLLTTSGEILRSNKAASDLLKRSPAELPGKHCFEVVHNTLDFIEGCPFVKAMSSHHRESYNLKMWDSWYRITVDPVLNSDGAVIGAIHIITDINEIVRVHEIRAHLGAVVEGTEEAVIGEALDGTITSWNGGAETIYGYSEEEIVGRPFSFLVPEGREEEHHEISARVRKGETVRRMETKRRKKDGELVEVSLSLSPIHDERGVLSGIASLSHDISDRRKAERALLAYVAEGAMRLKNPVEVIRNNLGDIRSLLKDGSIDLAELEMLLQVQETNADKIISNLSDLQRAITEGADAIPESYREFLLQ